MNFYVSLFDFFRAKIVYDCVLLYWRHLPARLLYNDFVCNSDWPKRCLTILPEPNQTTQSKLADILRQICYLLFNLLCSTSITTSAGKKPHTDLNLGPRGCAISRDAKPVATCTSSPSCVMWIHLQTSICTEWEHSSMVSYNKPKLCNQVPSLSLSRWRTLTLLKI